MGNRWIIYFLAVPMAFLCGCGDGESSGREECEQQKSEGQVHIEAAPTSAVTNEVETGVAVIGAEESPADEIAAAAVCGQCHDSAIELLHLGCRSDLSLTTQQHS